MIVGKTREGALASSKPMVHMSHNSSQPTTSRLAAEYPPPRSEDEDDMSMSSVDSDSFLEILPELANWSKDEDQEVARLEELLIARLDDEITAAEERALLQILNDNIVAEEERYLLEKLRFSIDIATVKERTAKEWGSRVDYVLTANDDIPPIDDDYSAGSDLPNVELARSIDRSSFNWGSRVTIGDPDLTGNEIELIDERCLYTATKLIPKYFDSRSQPLITLESFEHNVTSKVNAMLSRDARIAEDCLSLRISLREIDSDPDSYVLVASGSKPVLDVVKSQTSSYIYHIVGRRNMRRIISDEQSVSVDIRVDAHAKLGVQILTYENTYIEIGDEADEDGVWIKGVINPLGSLASALGENSINDGAVIMAVDGKRCRSPTMLQKFINEARGREGDGMMTLSLYLSKFVDLSSVAEPANIRICLKNGQPYVKLAKEPLRLQMESPPFARQGSKSSNRRSEEDKITVAICRKILGDPASVELDVMLSPNESIGADVFNDTSPDADNENALLIQRFEPNGQLERILGKNACHSAAVLVEADGVTGLTRESLKHIMAHARESNEIFRIRIWFRDGTDLRDLDITRLYPGVLFNPRRRNGNPYPPWTWCEPPAVRGGGQKRKFEGSELSVSSKKAKSARSDASQHNQQGKPSNKDGPFAVYRTFKEKYKQLRSIEYKPVGITMQKAASSMWIEHKKMYGENAACDDHCKCIFELQKLTRNVVDDFRNEELKNDPEKTLGLGQPVGFVNHFAPRFIPRLSKEYPSESPSKLLGRLSEMWDIHKKNRILGMTCRKDCQCGEFWEILFGRGDPSRSSKPTKAQPRNDIGPVRKKPKVVPDSLSDSVKNTKSKSLESDVGPSDEGVVSRPLPRKTTLPRKTIEPESTRELRRSYVVTFDSTNPLGAFFVTGWVKSEKRKRCKVYSVWDKGEAKKDPRILPGRYHESCC